ncbi:GNAT family N-acyltransferase [Pelosinus fermentans]|uniref:Cyclic nucleotide-binding protein n=1 Tax=Pelosinus fermentans JBW45 TaxID=1192197 RepID=I9DJD1_9FIRM|nr:GNAT family N-acyltransferase [Pelosinus fermentans]AJQ30028.1 cyclic nucleotide-binding protein [Pelosinus fermentans JBW45]
MTNINQATSVSTKEEPIRIGVAKTPEEKREVYRLRYSIYAEEIGYDLADADHNIKLLYDELDEWAILLTAHIGSTLIGTVRVNIGRISEFSSDLVQTYRMAKFRKFYNEEDDPFFTVISRGMVTSQYRSSATIYLFTVKMYELSCAYQVQFAFLNCTFHLIPFYEHTGQVRIDKNTIDPNDNSSLASLVMLIDDVEHLRTVGSPLFRIARKRTSLNSKATDWFYSEFFREIKTTVNSRLVSEEELWTIMYQYFGNRPNNNISLLKGLSVSEAKLFLHSCGSLVHCHVGDYIAACGSTSQELIILLSGRARSSLYGILLPGQYCGENGLEYPTTRSSSVIALVDLDILVLSFYNFGNFRKRHSVIACKILCNLQK